MIYLLNYYLNVDMLNILKAIIFGEYRSELYDVKKDINNTIAETNIKIDRADRAVKKNISITKNLARVTGGLK